MRFFRKASRTLFIVMLALTLGACAGGGLKMPEAPSVGLSSLQLVSPGLRSQTFRVGLDLKNPNNFSLPLRGFSYKLKLNGVDVAEGVNSQSITLPAGGSSALQMDISMDLFSLFGRLKSAGLLTGQPVKYELSGNVGLLTQGLTLPFNRAGEIAITR